jgi:hypothetical protein
MPAKKHWIPVIICLCTLKAIASSDVVLYENFSGDEKAVFSRCTKVQLGSPLPGVEFITNNPIDGGHGIKMTLRRGSDPNVRSRVGIDLPIDRFSLVPDEQSLEIIASVSGLPLHCALYFMGKNGTQLLSPLFLKSGRNVFTLRSFNAMEGEFKWSDAEQVRIQFFAPFSSDQLSTVIISQVAVRSMGNEPDYSVLTQLEAGGEALNIYSVFPEPQQIHQEGQPVSFSNFVLHGSASLKSEMGSFRQGMAEKQIKEVKENGYPVVLGLDTKISSSPEGYVLRITQNGVEIKSPSSAGIFYGLKTLLQLIRKNGSEITLPHITITDYPYSSMRGVFLDLIGSNASQPTTMDDLKKLFRVFSDCKINTLFLEFSNNIKYDSPILAFPGRASYAFSKSQIKELVAYARSLHLEVIPYIQMMTHCTWIMANPENKRFLEDPSVSPGEWSMNWCPRHPGINKFTSVFIDETVELFGSRRFCVGLDESCTGQFGICERCRGSEKKTLLKEATLNLYQQLKAKNQQMIMYHDSFTANAPGIGWEILDDLPKDILVNIWDYGTDVSSCKKQIRDFKGKGFHVMGTSFMTPENHRMIAELFGQEDGMMISYWYLAYQWTPLDVLGNYPLAITAYGTAYAWNPKKILQGEHYPDAVNLIARRLYDLPNEQTSCNSTILPLPCNRRFGSQETDWPGKVNRLKIPLLPAELLTSFGKFKFSDKSNLLVLSGYNDDKLPKEITLKVNGKAKYISFLHACNLSSNAGSLNNIDGYNEIPILGYYDVQFQNGEKVSIPIRYRREINDWNSLFSGRMEQTVYQTMTPDRYNIRLGLYTWRNPYPSVAIDSITFRSACYKASSIAVAGVGLVR